MISSPKIAIIGAGIAGLTLANRLHVELQDRADITLFEKARGVSGRTSTRRAEPYHFDHGAPFFTAKSEAFKAFIAPMIKAGVLTDWQANVIEMCGTQVTDSYQWQADRHFVAQPKMNEMAKFLAKDLNIQLGSRVGKIEKTASNQWVLTSDMGKKVGKEITEPMVLGEHGDLGTFDWVICTAPAQQSAQLVPTSLPFYERIANSKTDGCYALMLGFEAPLNLSFDVALIKNSALSCVVVNSRKPNRPNAFAFTILSSNDWAESHIDADQAWVKNQLLKTASPIVGVDLTKPDVRANHISLHRWRYANTSQELEQNNLAQSHYLIDTQDQFAVAGDWLIKGSVESAFISANELACELLQTLSQ